MKRITVILDNKTAIAVLQLLADKAAVSINFEDVPNGEADEVREPIHRHVRADGRTAIQVIAETYKVGTTFTRTGAERLITDHGWNVATASPILSELVRAGYLKRTGQRNSLTYDVVKSLPTKL